LRHDQHTFPLPVATSTSRLRPRICLRKGCGRTYQPNRWNQRYCQDAECMRLLRRWQAAKRQRMRRSRPEIRQKHAAVEQDRRARRSDHPPAPKPKATPKRAWSRSKKNSCPLCDRPGCYDSPRPSCRCPARYCGNECRQAVRRVCDRERKWLNRKTPAGRYKRSLEYQAQRARRATRLGDGTKHDEPVVGSSFRTVVNYKDPDTTALSCRAEEVPGHDRETSAGTGSRAPPAS
jgi:hypothetical protein